MIYLLLPLRPAQRSDPAEIALRSFLAPPFVDTKGGKETSNKQCRFARILPVAALPTAESSQRSAAFTDADPPLNPRLGRGLSGATRKAAGGRHGI